LGYLATRSWALGQVVGGYRGGDYDLAGAVLYLGRSAGRFASLLVEGSHGRGRWFAELGGAGLVAGWLALGWSARRWRGVGQILLVLGASLAAVVPILDYPLIRFAEWKSPLDDRLALAFGAAVLLGLVHSLFGCSSPGRAVVQRLAALSLVCLLFASTVVTLSGLASERLTATQWGYLRAHLRDEVVVIGISAADLSSLGRLAGEDGKRRMRAYEPGARPENVVLVTAGQPVRSAVSREEVEQWVGRWGGGP